MHYYIMDLTIKKRKEKDLLYVSEKKWKSA